MKYSETFSIKFPSFSNLCLQEHSRGNAGPVTAGEKRKNALFASQGSFPQVSFYHRFDVLDNACSLRVYDL